MIEVSLALGSLTAGNEDVLVNASNTIVQLGSGVSGAIARACGPTFQAELTAAMQLRFGGAMEPGDVLLTGAGKHPRATSVAHVAVMDYRPGAREVAPDLARIEKGCVGLWRSLAELPGPLSVAMVALGAGTGALGVADPTEIACRTLQETPPPSVQRVVFYGYQLHELAPMAAVVGRFFPRALESLDAETRAFVERLASQP
jgi:O-acetyl-ADP-ribose deacetylase (regulator of RNase III)